MRLLSCWLEIVSAWQCAFPQRRSWSRAVGQALATLTVFGRCTLSRTIWAPGQQQKAWSAAYKLHARVAGDPHELLQVILQRALPLCKGRYVAEVSL